MQAANIRHPLNTVAPYFTMFPPSFPLEVLRGQTGWILDPFCGRGTSLFAARVLGLPCVGIDSSPVAAAIAAAKLVDVAPSAVVEKAQQYLNEADGIAPEGEFWSLAYHPRTLRELCAVRSGLLSDMQSPEAVALRAVMLGALHGPRGKTTRSYLSNQMPRTYATKPAGAVRYWRKRALVPEYASLLQVVARRAGRAFTDAPSPVDGVVIQGDARSVEVPAVAGGVSHVVTSPPYYGMRTYLTDQWLRHWFLGGPETPDYRSDRQMDMSSPGAFAADLGQVWQRIASAARPGCRMTVRFGAIPSAPSSPEAIIRDSLERADSQWSVERVDDAGLAVRGRRQSEQFGFVKSKPIQEVDVIAVLGG